MKALLIICSLLVALPASASGIEDHHRACHKDSDCAVVVIGCHCMYCARADDKEKGVVDSVNKKFSKKFAEFSKCTDEQMHGCSMAGPCAMSGNSLPVCRSEKCTIVFHPF